MALPPVAGAIVEIFVRNGVSASGKKAVVVGAGKLVGTPAAQLLRDLGAHVTVVTHTRGSLEELKDADIVVLGAGEPGLVKPEMLKQGVVLIDAGTSESSGKLAGDADPACAHVASVFTPVPGGVGPIAVAMIFKNLLTLARMAQK
jgi:methylenetetrahydrofolate dehydrogenase (NADP+)/methenyltetrahydrofolate cyclohydrolase